MARSTAGDDQWRVGVGGLNALTMWLANMAKARDQGFHNREKRRQLEEELPRSGVGQYRELSRLLDSADERGADVRLSRSQGAMAGSYRHVLDIEEGQRIA